MSKIDFDSYVSSKPMHSSIITNLGNDDTVQKSTVQPKQMIFYEGDPADFVYEVVSGSVKLYKLLADGRRQITGFFFPGDLICIGLQSEYTHSADRYPKTYRHTFAADTYPRSCTNQTVQRGFSFQTNYS